MEPLTAGLLAGGGLLLAALGYALGRRHRGLRRRGLDGGENLDATFGFNYLLADDVDRAIEAFTRVTQTNQGAVEIYLLLGNLYREKGQVEQAIHVHRGLLERRGLRPETRALALYCLALDFKKGGLVDRAIETFEELFELEGEHVEALKHLQKLYEDVGDWSRAYETARKLARLEDVPDSPVLAYLQNELGQQALKTSDIKAAQRHFERALDLHAECVPASINLGSLLLAQKRYKKARAVWEQMLERKPGCVHLVASRLREVYEYLGEEELLGAACLKLEQADPGAWRGRMILGETAEARRDYDEAFAHYTESLRRHPHALSTHQRIWNLMAKMGADSKRIHEYLDICEETVALADRHVCLKCHYRATELLWRCPSCHEWASFVEETGE
jgi:lipopolysaccharide biosynthesis regulator YciM